MTESRVDISQVKVEQVAELRELMEEYLAWAFTLDSDSAYSAPTFKGVDDELRDLPGIFAPPSGRFLIAVLDGKVCGAVALKPVDERTCELKRLYVRPDARGHNVGGQLVEQLLCEAKGAGYERMILDSHRSMTAAHAIYRKAGFTDVDPWEGFPAELAPLVVFMEANLYSDAAS